MVLVQQNFQSTGKNFFQSDNFKQIEEDPTQARLTSVPIYLKQINKTGKLPHAKFKEIRQQYANLARTHVLSKVHSTFEIFQSIPSFYL